MAKEAGMAILHEKRAPFISDGTASPGDFVSLGSDGKVTTVDSTTDTKVTGVLSNSRDNYGHEDGDKVSVNIGGVVIANVATGTGIGDMLGPSATEGEAASGGTDAEAYCDEGGSYEGSACPAGTAAVNLEV